MTDAGCEKLDYPVPATTPPPVHDPDWLSHQAGWADHGDRLGRDKLSRARGALRRHHPLVRPGVRRRVAGLRARGWRLHGESDLPLPGQRPRQRLGRPSPGNLHDLQPAAPPAHVERAARDLRRLREVRPQLDDEPHARSRRLSGPRHGAVGRHGSLHRRGSPGRSGEQQALPAAVRPDLLGLHPELHPALPP